MAADPARTDQVVKWLLSGARDRDVIEAIQQFWPGQDIVPLIQGASDALRNAGEADPGVIRGWCIEATRDLYRRMVEIGDLIGALRAVKMLYDLAGKEA